ncbi:MAG: hypothetical protein SGJ10_01170 [Bacteroidota bacterium]|nr:hypothetical protein [Bacteroidota bacterium]
MIKIKLYIVVFFIVSVIYTSCEKADMKENRLCRGNGKWNITQQERIAYDSVGAVLWDSISTDLGELNFFKEGSLDALYDYRVGVMYLKQMPELERLYRFEYFTDGNRFNIKLDGTLIDPSKDIARFYSVKYDGYRKKELVYVKSDGNRPITTNSSQLYYKEILTIEKD